jgi:hypothetical protein
MNDCGDAGGRLAILEGELPGEIRKRARARAGCPGIAALLHSLLLSGLGSRLPQGLQRSDSPNHASAASTGKSGTPCERCRTSTIVSPLLAAGRQDERSTNDATPVAGRRRICFWRLLFSQGFARIGADKPASECEGFLYRTCFLRSSTTYCLPSQLLHNSFGASLCLRLS